MKPSSQSRLTIAWLALSAITLLSWLIGSHHGVQAYVHAPAVTLGVILISGIKVRVILGEFMELRHATVTVRRVVDIWLIVLVALLLLLYFHGAQIRFLSALSNN